jgi:hypothetical protein
MTSLATRSPRKRTPFLDLNTVAGEVHKMIPRLMREHIKFEFGAPSEVLLDSNPMRTDRKPCLARGM